MRSSRYFEEDFIEKEGGEKPHDDSGVKGGAEGEVSGQFTADSARAEALYRESSSSPQRFPPSSAGDRANKMRRNVIGLTFVRSGRYLKRISLRKHPSRPDSESREAIGVVMC